jgi:hypothetical protein
MEQTESDFPSYPPDFKLNLSPRQGENNPFHYFPEFSESCIMDMANIFMPAAFRSTHDMLAAHLAAEIPMRVTANGRSIEEWRTRSGTSANHWLDGLVMNAAAASLCGVTLPGSTDARLAAKPKLRLQRPPKKEMTMKKPTPLPGLRCPRCGCNNLRVYYTRPQASHIRRIRRCYNCGQRLVTREMVV